MPWIDGSHVRREPQQQIARTDAHAKIRVSQSRNERRHSLLALRHEKFYHAGAFAGVRLAQHRNEPTEVVRIEAVSGGFGDQGV